MSPLGPPWEAVSIFHIGRAASLTGEKLEEAELRNIVRHDPYAIDGMLKWALPKKTAAATRKLVIE